MALVELPTAFDGHIAPPTVATSQWAGLLPANDHTIRAAIFTCSKVVGSEIKIYRADRRILLGMCQKRGWSITLSTDGQKRDKLAVRSSDFPSSKSVRANWLNNLFILLKGRFNDFEAEIIIRDFVGNREADASFINWVDIDRR